MDMRVREGWLTRVTRAGDCGIEEPLWVREISGAIRVGFMRRSTRRPRRRVHMNE